MFFIHDPVLFLIPVLFRIHLDSIVTPFRPP